MFEPRLAVLERVVLLDFLVTASSFCGAFMMSAVSQWRRLRSEWLY
jgi:hypothetical protein